MSYESWRISYQSSEAAARAAYATTEKLHAELTALRDQLAAIGAGGVEPLHKQAAPAALAVPMAEDWEQSAADTEHQRTGAGLHFNQGVAEGLRICAKDLRAALAATAAADAPMVDMTPPATSRDRWMYEQGRLAERDARTPGSVAAAAPVVLPEPFAYVEHHKAGDNLWFDHPGGKHSALYTEQQVRALLAAHAQTDARDVERWIGIGKAIERACMDLPDGTEISVSLEKDAGTVTLIDQDGIEHENFSCDYGFAGVLNEAIDAALAAQAKHEVQL